jgi:hypothetical protein
MVQMGIEGEALTAKSPDQMLIHKPCDAICTSDTAIIDHTQSKVIDLPCDLLKRFFQTEFPSLAV